MTLKILYVVQRYGANIVGGSEAAARAFAEHLVVRGHSVDVLTSCAQSYSDWANVYDEGTSELNGVTVHRLAVDAPRSPEKFGPLHQWMIEGPKPAPMFVQQRWAKHMGPDIPLLPRWLTDRAANFDLVVFMTYLYATTTRGLPAVAGRVPTILQPTAHDEPPLWVRIYDSLFRLPDAFLFFTPEERSVVTRRFGIDPIGMTAGIGVDLDQADDVSGFREFHGLDDEPYILYVGRIDAIKGSLEAFHFFVEYKRRNPGPLRFVFVGEAISDLPDHPEVVFTGFLDEDEKRNALAGALALIQPSRFESFSIVLCESWVQHRPALVHADSEVLVGQAKRSKGAIPYRGFAEFEAALDLFVGDPDLADRMGASGYRYVDERYRWDQVIDAFEATATEAISAFARRPKFG
jgi:glycosyltransferase involved in cell wall biosynthesis